MSRRHKRSAKRKPYSSDALSAATPTMKPFIPDLYQHVGHAMSDIDELTQKALSECRDIAVIAGLVAANTALRSVQKALYSTLKARSNHLESGAHHVP